jgi:hypothetical protein
VCACGGGGGGGGGGVLEGSLVIKGGASGSCGSNLDSKFVKKIFEKRIFL